MSTLYNIVKQGFEIVFRKINPASVKLAVIFKILWPLALFHKLSKKGVIFRYMKMEIWIYRTEQNICHENSALLM